MAQLTPNEKRADRGLRALSDYQKRRKQPKDAEEDITDLITDLLHLAGEKQLGVMKIMGNAMGSYEDEIMDHR